MLTNILALNYTISIKIEYFTELRLFLQESSNLFEK